MKTTELRQKLIAVGCNENNFAILARGDDAFCLDKNGLDWVVFYSERGLDSEPIFKSRSEDEACTFFFEYLSKQQHWHLVGFFKSEDEARELEQKLAKSGMQPIRNDMPAYRKANDPRYRVFVVGKDILKVREQFSSIEINYD